MNSDMFMKWVYEKLVSCFERKYPGKKMVLVADIARYHHKREVGSLGSLSKAKLVEMMGKHSVEYVDLSIANVSRQVLTTMEGDDEQHDIQDRGEYLWLGFVMEEQKKKAGAAHPRISTLEELKVEFMMYLNEERPNLFICKVEKYLEERGHCVL